MEKVIFVCVQLCVVVNVIGGIPVTTRQKSQSLLRKDRLDYALSEDRQVYAAKFLQRFGYMGDLSDMSQFNENMFERALEMPLKRFQAFYGIEATGKDSVLYTLINLLAVD